MDESDHKAQKSNEKKGTITETLPNALFRVELENGETILAYISGKMRLNRIRVMVGDTVLMEADDHGSRARIVRRL